MISINLHIRYLLTRHDCVVVPGLGAFVAQRDNARIDESTGRLIPPCRRVGFNQSLQHDDGLLASSVSRREGVSYDVARTLIANDVEMMRSRLQSSRMAILPRLGRFDREGGRLVFTPDETSLVVNSRFAALPAISVLPAIQSPEVETMAADNDAVHVLELDYRSRERSLRRWRVAASVALLLGLGGALSTPVLVDREQLSYASVTAPALVKGPHAVQLPAVAERRTVEVVKPLYITRPDAAEATATVHAGPVAQLGPEALPTYDHYVIVASCETIAKARRFVGRRKSQHLGILPSDGRFRIYAAATATRTQAEAARTASLLSRYPDAWIYSRR